MLTTDNPDEDSDKRLFKKLGLQPARIREASDEAQSAQLLDEIAEQVSPSLFYDATSVEKNNVGVTSINTSNIGVSSETR